MLPIPAPLQASFEGYLQAKEIPQAARPHYKKWLRFYLDFCQKYHAAPSQRGSLALFLEKLQEKRQPEWQRQQATDAVSLYYELLQAGGDDNLATLPGPNRLPLRVEENPAIQAVDSDRRSAPPPYSADSSGKAGRQLKGAEQPLRPDVASANRARPLSGASWEAEYGKLVEEIRIRHYSPKTLKTYRHWLRHFQAFSRSKPTESLTTADVKEFLTWLAVKREVSASTQNQAFNALLFFYRHVLHREFGKVDGVVRAKRKPYIPVVLSPKEIKTVLSHLVPPYDLAVKLLYGCGLRLSECLNLRVQCLNFDAGVITVHDGKG